jgi:ribosomal protein S18 acetylase RimI-like enzyme
MSASPTIAPPQGVRLRDARADDDHWLANLFADVRRPEFALLGWSDAALTGFLATQFDAQQRAYRAAHPAARLQIIECDVALAAAGDARIGRWWVDHTGKAIEVLDIGLLAAWRGRGIGGWCLTTLLAQAAEQGLSVDLRVIETNPARRLYQRLGFEVIGSEPPYLTMRKPAAGAPIPHRAESIHEQA